MNKLYNKSFENYDNEYNILSDVKKNKFDLTLKLINLKNLKIMIVMNGLQKEKKN